MEFNRGSYCLPNTYTAWNNPCWFVYHLSLPPDDLPYSSYEEQNQAEINKTYNRLEGLSYTIAADFNTGPEVSSSDPEKNLTAEAPNSYALLQHYGYE